jgi:hypothetical protein
VRPKAPGHSTFPPSIQSHPPKRQSLTPQPLSSYPPNSALEKWGKLIVTAAAALGRSADSALLYQTQMEAVGFVDIVEKRYKWPSNGWPKDKKIKELGLWNYANMGESVSGISMALFTRGLGWSVEELELFLVDVRKEMKNTKIHAYWDM